MACQRPPELASLWRLPNLSAKRSLSPGDKTYIGSYLADGLALDRLATELPNDNCRVSTEKALN
jgi:hypothetical protein